MKKIDREQLLACNDQQLHAMRGKKVRITKNNGMVIEGVITQFGYSPQSLGLNENADILNRPSQAMVFGKGDVVGFILHDGHHIGFDGIKEIELED